MSEFTVRIELNGNSTGMHYEQLHAAMEAKGFTRYLTITTTGEKMKLPKAEYNRVGTFTNQQVFNDAKEAAESVWSDVDIISTESAGRVVQLKPYK